MIFGVTIASRFYGKQGLPIFKYGRVNINFLQPPADQQHTQKIEAKTDKKHHRSKLFDLFDPGHDLGDPDKHPDTGQGECNAPDELDNDFVFIFRGVLVFI